jgi:thiamine biosynthesis lipoprotein
LDLSSIAKGYTVDAVSEFLLSKNILNHKIDIGGELVCKGLKTNGNGWLIEVKRPERDTDKKRQLLELKDLALATSGNYANIRTYSNKEYGHTLNPKTGKPETNELLSVSIFSDNCMKADAFATACMAAGLKRSIQMIEQNEDLEGYLIYREGDGVEEYYSPKVKKMIYDE